MLAYGCAPRELCPHCSLCLHAPPDSRLCMDPSSPPPDLWSRTLIREPSTE